MVFKNFLIFFRNLELYLLNIVFFVVVWCFLMDLFILCLLFVLGFFVVGWKIFFEVRFFFLRLIVLKDVSGVRDELFCIMFRYNLFFSRERRRNINIGLCKFFINNF